MPMAKTPKSFAYILRRRDFAHPWDFEKSWDRHTAPGRQCHAGDRDLCFVWLGIPASLPDGVYVAGTRQHWGMAWFGGWHPQAQIPLCGRRRGTALASEPGWLGGFRRLPPGYHFCRRCRAPACASVISPELKTSSRQGISSSSPGQPSLQQLRYHLPWLPFSLLTLNSDDRTRNLTLASDSVRLLLLPFHAFILLSGRFNS